MRKLTFKLLALTSLLILTSATVQAYEPRSLAHETQIYRRAMQITQNVFRNCRDCSFAQSESADPVCRSKFDKVYLKNQVNIHLAIGYMDDSENPSGGYYAGVQLQPNEAIDGIAQEGFLRNLTTPCRNRDGQGACGFSRQSGDQNLLVKTIQYRGQTTQVNLRVTNAAATPILSTNTTEGARRQALATRMAEENFFESLSTSDLTIYTGHARGGGGPDFAPPVLKDDGTANYNGYYRVKKPGLTRLLAELNKANAHPTMMAILACKSDDLFRGPVLQAAPSMSWVATSDLVYFEDGFIATYLVLDGFLRQECQSTFQKTLLGLETTNGTYLRLKY
jgi:hypothetical protein